MRDVQDNPSLSATKLYARQHPREASWGDFVISGFETREVVVLPCYPASDEWSLINPPRRNG